MSIRDEELSEFEATIRRNQMTPEEVAKLAEGVAPFSFEEWSRIAPVPTADELQEMEELLRLREREREESLAREAGIGRS